MNRREWKATHRIFVQESPATGASTWLVMLDDGKFYTEGIWENCGDPEWIQGSTGQAEDVAGGLWTPHNRTGRIILQDLAGLPTYMPDVADSSDAALLAIRRHAEVIRDAIERTSYTEEDGMMRQFPNGCCHHACHILGIYLFEETNCGAFETVSGEHNEETHCWLEQDGNLVDITADQFEGMPKIVVTRLSNWHDSFLRLPRYERTESDADYFNRIKTSRSYDTLYSRIKANIAE